MGKIFDELHCQNCGKKLSNKQPLFDTAWSGVYWCGSIDCAMEIMSNCCEEFDSEDECNRED